MKKKATTIHYRGTIEHRNQSADLLTKPGDFAIIKRGGINRLMVMKCPCGCGDDLLINLDGRAGDAWRLYRKSSEFTLYPSYWRDTACHSHFIIWKNGVYWSYYPNDNFEEKEVSEEVQEVVLSNLDEDRYFHYLELSDRLDLLPWESLHACRQLVKKGVALANPTSRYEFRKYRK